MNNMIMIMVVTPQAIIGDALKHLLEQQGQQDSMVLSFQDYIHHPHQYDNVKNTHNMLWLIDIHHIDDYHAIAPLLDHKQVIMLVAETLYHIIKKHDSMNANWLWVYKPFLITNLYHHIQHYHQHHLVKDIIFNSHNYQLCKNTMVVPLTPIESHILHYLYQKRPHIVTSSELIALLWSQQQHDAETNIIAVHISKLRKKLAKLGTKNLIATAKTQGYYYNETP